MKSKRPLGTRLLAIVLGCCCGLGSLERAEGVVITMKNGKRIGCWIIEKRDETVVVDVVNEAGERDRQELKRADVDDVAYAVSATRLAELKPAQPIAYKRYAEELAQITIDPEARPMSLRLYHIALTLNPDEMLDSCLLGMIGVARSKAEERRFRAAAFLHRSNADPAVLVTSETAAVVDDDDDLHREDDATLRLLREFRSRKRLLVQPNEIPKIRKALAPYTDSLTDEEVSKLFLFDCQQCQNGMIDCPACERGVTVRGNRRMKCTQCQRGSIPCRICNAPSGKKALSDDLAMRLINAEIAILSKHAEQSAVENSPAEDAFVPWSQIKSAARTKTIPALSLRNLTDFDPSKCLFQSGQWVAPKG